MTTFNNEINRIFKEMSRSFGSVDDIFEALQNTNGTSGPFYYGYTTVSYTHLTLPTIYTV